MPDVKTAVIDEITIEIETRELGAVAIRFERCRDPRWRSRRFWTAVWADPILARFPTKRRDCYDALSPVSARFSPRDQFCMLLLSGCATQPPPAAPDLPGFFSGLLHGFLILFSFIGSLFADYRIYAFPNSGGWYDFGFLLGATVFLGGSGAGGTK